MGGRAGAVRMLKVVEDPFHEVPLCRGRLLHHALSLRSHSCRTAERDLSMRVCATPPEQSLEHGRLVAAGHPPAALDEVG